MTDIMHLHTKKKTDCQKHWEAHYNDYTKEQMQRIIINLL